MGLPGKRRHNEPARGISEDIPIANIQGLADAKPAVIDGSTDR